MSYLGIGLTFIFLQSCATVTPPLASQEEVGPPVSLARSFDISSVIHVSEILSSRRLQAFSKAGTYLLHEKLALVSSEPDVGVYGYVQIQKIQSTADGRSELEMEIISLSEYRTVQLGDLFVRLNLKSEQEQYWGRTDLLVRESKEPTSARYRPLFTQGLSIGETAETLWKDEFFITYYGQIYYGLYDWLSVGTLVPLNAIGSANGALKTRLYESDSNVVSTGLSYTKIPNTDSSSLNINFMWDSFSNKSLITHNFISLAVVTFKDADEATALKSLGSSSLQTGYEFILDDWSRILVGPNFNFEKKSVGGYLSYLKIWDRLHLQFSLNSTNIQSLKLSPNDGYYAFIDAYWRY